MHAERPAEPHRPLLRGAARIVHIGAVTGATSRFARRFAQDTRYADDPTAARNSVESRPSSSTAMPTWVT